MRARRSIAGTGGGIRRPLVAAACLLAVAVATLLPAGAGAHDSQYMWPMARLAHTLDDLNPLLFPPAPATVPKARCGPDDRPETGLQGQGAPLVDQLTGRTKAGYTCNTRLVGETTIGNRGNNVQMAWAGDCAYVATAHPAFLYQMDPIDPTVVTSHPAGLAVIDATDPSNPRHGDILRTRGSADSFEMLTSRDTPTRKIVVAGDYEGKRIDVYDAGDDCRKPKLKASWDLPLPGHNVTLSPDGKTLYATVGIKQQPIASILFNASVMAVDLTDMADPELIGSFPLTDDQGTKWSSHEVDVSADGTRIYAAATTGVGDQAHTPIPFFIPRNGDGAVLIFDSSDIAARRPDPKLEFISAWRPGGRHSARVGQVGDQTILVAADELGECLTAAYPRIADITDERNPVELSQYRLQVHDPANCPRVLLDMPGAAFYSSHYNDIDSSADTKLGLFPMSMGGLRIADLRDPVRPKEIGYYIPRVNPAGIKLDPGLARCCFNPNVAQFVHSNVRYRPEKRQVWLTSWTGGFHIIELSEDVAP